MLFLPVSLFQPELETQSTREIFHLLQFHLYMQMLFSEHQIHLLHPEEARLVLQKETDIIVVSMQRPPSISL